MKVKTNRHLLKRLFASTLVGWSVWGNAAVQSDLVCSYPPSTAAGWGGEANARVNIANGVIGSNALNDQSGTGQSLNIAGYIMSSRDSVGEDNGTVLGLVAGDAAYADVRNYAASVGADQVLYVPYQSTGAAGNAYQPGTYSAINSTWWWMVVVAHETGGHNYGCAHGDDHLNPKGIMMHNYCGGGAAYPYLYGNPNVWQNGVNLLGDGYTCLGGGLINGGDNAYKISASAQGMCDTTLRVVYAPVLTNAIYRWCFTNAAASAPNNTTNYDLVSGAPAIVRGNGATYTGNALRIPGGTTGNASVASIAAYIDLPNHILSSQTNITIEVWATPRSVQNWGRILDFGRTTEAGDGLGAAGEWTGLPGTAAPNNTSQSDGLLLSSSIGTDINQQRFETRHNGTVYTVDTGLATTAGVQHHYAITFTDGLGAFGSAGGRWQWYRDGDIVEFLDVSNHLASIQDVNNWLGRSEWSADSLANADYAEVRISKVALNQWQVKANYLLGPNYVPRSTTMAASDLWNGSTRSFNTAGNWGDGLAPGAGKSYDMSDFNLTTPNSTAPFTFAGDSLHASGGIFFCGASGSATISVNKFQIDNEEICNSASGTFTLAGNLYVTNACILRGAGGQVNVSANLNGNGSLTLYANTVSLTGNNTNFTGKIRVGNGIIGNMNLSSEAQLGANPPSFTADQLILNRGWLYTTSSFTISNSNRGILIGVNDGIFDQAAGTTLTLGCPLSSGETIVSAGQMTTQAEPAGIVAGVLIKQNSGTLALTSSNPNYNGAISISAGTLAIAGAGQLGGGNFGNPFTDNGVFSYSSTANQTISSAIGGSGSVVKNNSSILVLSGANTFTGSTTINGGTLLVNGSLGGGAVKAVSGQLSGNGTVGGAVTVQSGGTLSPGSGVGTLTVNNSVTLQAGGTTLMELSKGQNANDQLVVSGSLTCGGTLVVTNLSGSLVAGDTFKLFQAGTITGSFGSVSLPALSAGLGWSTANLSNGVIRVVQTTPTNVVWNLSGTNLMMSWPTDYTGWRLQIQTNPMGVGLGSNWIDVPGSTATNNLTLPVDATVGNAFYRLIYP